jgi:hypothetical protein
MWTLVTLVTLIGTAKVKAARNGFLFTKKLTFKIISEGTDCPLDEQSNREKIIKSDP